MQFLLLSPDEIVAQDEGVEVGAVVGHQPHLPPLPGGGRNLRPEVPDEPPQALRLVDPIDCLSVLPEVSVALAEAVDPGGSAADGPVGHQVEAEVVKSLAGGADGDDLDVGVVVLVIEPGGFQVEVHQHR